MHKPGVAALLVVSLGLAACGHDAVRALPGEPPLHEPAGFHAFSDQPWNTLTGNGWQYLRRSSSKDDDIVVDSSMTPSPVRVLRIIFTPDMAPDAEPSVHWIPLPWVKAVYAVWWIRLSPNWTSSPAGGGKITFLWAADSLGQVYTGFFGSTAPHHISVNTEWAPYGQKIWAPNVITTPVYYGQWYRIEWFMQWESSPGAGDGVMRWWVNGAPNGAYTNVRFPRGVIGFHQFEFAPTLQLPPPTEQYMYVERTYLSIP